LGVAWADRPPLSSGLSARLDVTSMLSSVQFRIFVRLSSEVQNNGDRDRKCSGDLRSAAVDIAE